MIGWHICRVFQNLVRRTDDELISVSRWQQHDDDDEGNKDTTDSCCNFSNVTQCGTRSSKRNKFVMVIFRFYFRMPQNMVISKSVTIYVYVQFMNNNINDVTWCNIWGNNMAETIFFYLALFNINYLYKLEDIYIYI